MAPIKLDHLISAITRNITVQWEDPGLKALLEPSPYVPPKFTIQTTDALGQTAANKLAVEVIFVQAPAAVGKSITAAHISSCTNAPVLDLATFGIGGASLDGLLTRSAHYDGLRKRDHAIEEFHSGNLPIIIDALDEGQMSVGQSAFEAFLNSTADLILDERHTTNKPKIIFFGRPEAADLADLAVKITGNQTIKSCVVDLEFFSQDEATTLIKAYAIKAMEDANYTSRIESINRPNSPYDDLIDWYFESIERALPISKGELWQDKTGKTFAGYAPVLSAIGRLLAEIEQPHVAVNTLKKDGQNSAWEVIQDVMQYILEREQIKVKNPLTKSIKESLSSGRDEEAWERVYDPQEQLAYLAQLVQKQPLTATGNVEFVSPAHNQEYIEKVRNFYGDHAFVRDGVAANDVFESLILSNAMRNGLLQGTSHVERVSRYPFLWRCFQHLESDRSQSLDGQQVGFLLRSFCSDPLVSGSGRIAIREESNIIRVELERPDDGRGVDAVSFTASGSLKLYGSITNCDMDLESTTVEIAGQRREGGFPSFYFIGENSINCHRAEITAEGIFVHGSLLIETVEQGVYNPQWQLFMVEGKGELVTSGGLSLHPPWRDWALQREVTFDERVPNSAKPVFQLIRATKVKLGKYPRIYTNARNQVDRNDPQNRWLCRLDGYQEFLNRAISSGLARQESVDRSGVFNSVIRFEISLDELREGGVRLVTRGQSSRANAKNRRMWKQIREFWSRYEITGNIGDG